jgi:HEAT repeat protein
MEKLMNFITQLLNPRSRFYLVLAFVILLSASAGVSAQSYRLDQDLWKLNRFVQAGKTDGPSTKAFREGRDQIEAGNWQQAAEKFQTFVKEYPKDKDVDAALYWVAYAEKKQDKKDEAAQYLTRLVREYPRSRWNREAQAMMIEIGRKPELETLLIQIKTDDDNCEMKILALQSLFQADEDRAINFVGEVLKSNTPQCLGLKRAAITMLGPRGGARAVPILLEVARSNSDVMLRQIAIKQLGTQNTDAVTDELARIYDADHTKGIRIQILRAFADTHSPKGETRLVEAARGADDIEVRQYAIKFLGQKKGDASLDEIIRIFDTDPSPVIRMQTLHALAQRDDPKAHAKLLDIARHGATPEIRVEAIRLLGGRGGAAYPELLQLYTSESDIRIKEGLLRTYGSMDDERATAKLYEVARSAEPLPLRMSAIRQLGSRDRNKPAVTAELIGMYDAEQNVQVRGALIRAFGDSKEKTVINKLISIARSDSSVELRKLAIRYLGESKDPDALKFLEELLK